MLKDHQLWGAGGVFYDDRVDKGLVAVWAYRCVRCGHIWLPKDYDVSDKNTLARDPPKSCARCKSKYWNIFPEDETDGGITRASAEDREFRHNKSPEELERWELERWDKTLKSLERSIRREERKNEAAKTS